MIIAKSTAFIIGPIASLLGLIIDVLYNALDTIGIGNITLSIILFTIITQILMIPLKYKSQKFTRISGLLQPKITKIREKYKGKRDQQSMALMNQEIQELYKSSGTSQVGGCLPMIIQMPILFALYAVIQSIPSYVERIGSLFGEVAEKIISGNYIAPMQSIKGTGAIENLVDKTNVIDYLYTFNISDWHKLSETIADLPKNSIDSILSTMKVFGGILVSDTPWDILKSNSYIHWIWIVPILVYASAYFSIKTTQTGSDDDNPQLKQMKAMSKIMPIISVLFSIALPVGLGIYWIVNSLSMGIQQIYMNKYIDKQGLEQMIKQNIEKIKVKENKAKEKQGYSVTDVSKAASLSTKGIKKEEKPMENVKPNSLAAIANLTDKYKDE